MRYPTPPALLTACILVAGCAATPASRARDQAEAVSTQQKLDARLAGYAPGKPIDCIPQYPTSHSEAIGTRILYSFSPRLIYVNETSGGCESLERGDILVTVSHTGQLCSGDIGRTVQPTIGISSGSCALGQFTPYEKK